MGAGGGIVFFFTDYTLHFTIKKWRAKNGARKTVRKAHHWKMAHRKRRAKMGVPKWALQKTETEKWRAKSGAPKTTREKRPTKNGAPKMAHRRLQRLFKFIFFAQNFTTIKKKFSKENFEIFWLSTPLPPPPTAPFCRPQFCAKWWFSPNLAFQGDFCLKIQDWGYYMCFFQSKAMISFNQRETKKIKIFRKKWQKSSKT